MASNVVRARLVVLATSLAREPQGIAAACSCSTTFLDGALLNATQEPPFAPSASSTLSTSPSSYTCLPSTSPSMSFMSHRSLPGPRPGFGPSPPTRCMSSLSRNSVPGPRPEVANQLSTVHGGHIVRRIKLAETTVILDDVLYSNRRKLTLVHVSVAAAALEKLYRSEKGSPSELKLKRVASELASFASTRAARMTAWQVSTLMRGLTNCNYRMSEEIILPMAAVLIQDKCQRLQLASDVEIKDVFYSFSQQGFKNPAFWANVCSTAAPRIATMDSKLAASIMNSLSYVRQPHKELLEACSARIIAGAAELEPRQLADLTASAAALSFYPPELVSALSSRALAIMNRFPAKLLAIFMDTIPQLHQPVPAELAAAASSQATSCASQMTPLYAAKAVASLASLGVAEKALYAAMAQSVQSQLPGCSPGLRGLLHSAFQKIPESCKPDINEFMVVLTAATCERGALHARA